MTLRMPRAAVILISAAAALGLTAGPALASTAGGGHGLSPQAFTLFISTDHPDGVVNAFGPVHGRGGTDNQVSNTLDQFVFDRGSVNVRHSDTSNIQPRIDWRSCTASAHARGWWRFDGGDGKFRDAAGFGTFKFAEFIVLKHRHGHCDTNPNDEPKYFQVVVTGRGLATTGGHGN